MLWIFSAVICSYVLCSCFGLSLKGSLNLRSLIETATTNNPSFKHSGDSLEQLLYNEVASVITLNGRAEVEAAAKTIQRMQLQLDRSDGRPDFTPDVLAEKYYTFLATCLRTKGAAWTVPLGPLSYIGFRFSEHIDKSDGLRIVNVPSLCTSMCKVLIDMPSGNTPIEAASIDRISKNDVAVRSLQDLAVMLLRLAIRVATFSEQLDGGDFPKSEPFDIAVQFLSADPTNKRGENLHLLSLQTAETVLLYDFDMLSHSSSLTSSVVEKDGGLTRLVVDKLSVMSFAEKNSLS